MVPFTLLVAIVICALPSTVAVAAERDQVVHVVRFTDYGKSKVDDWLRRKGFQLQRGARRRDQIELKAGANGLAIEALRPTYGLLINESVDVPDFSRVEIDWGVVRHPQGASYEQGIRNEAIMVIVFMGDERKPSGSLLIPNSPYFIGLFLCSGDDRENYPYVGSYFRKSGRYVCADRPPPGRIVTSRFELLEAYRVFFDQERDDDPAISGIAIAVDTQKASGGGSASAFVQEIRFYR